MMDMQDTCFIYQVDSVRRGIVEGAKVNVRRSFIVIEIYVLFNEISCRAF